MAGATELRQPPPLEACDLCFAYGERRVLDHVSLALGHAEILGVLGPNGSGKSTLVRVLSGVLAPAVGDVRLRGRPLAEYARREVGRAIAVVPQETVIEFPFSVTEVVLMGRSPHLAGFAFEDEDDLRIARAAMARTGVLDLAGREVHELSGGERQRVILARALAQEADILLLDEAAAFLDIRYQVGICDLLRALQREGRSIIAVLHDLNLAALYCDRVALLKAGRVAAVGAPSDVLTQATLTAVYETDVQVAINDRTGAVTVLPVGQRRGTVG